MSHDQDMLVAAGIEAERTRDSRSHEKSRSFMWHEEAQDSGVQLYGPSEDWVLLLCLEENTSN
jgi:hypothetical protein